MGYLMPNRVNKRELKIIKDRIDMYKTSDAPLEVKEAALIKLMKKYPLIFGLRTITLDCLDIEYDLDQDNM